MDLVRQSVSYRRGDTGGNAYKSDVSTAAAGPVAALYHMSTIIGMTSRRINGSICSLDRMRRGGTVEYRTTKPMARRNSRLPPSPLSCPLLFMGPSSYLHMGPSSLHMGPSSHLHMGLSSHLDMGPSSHLHMGPSSVITPSHGSVISHHTFTWVCHHAFTWVRHHTFT